MARVEADREDLFSEFRSARLKWELIIPGMDFAVVAGIRSDDRFSVYFSPDQVYHFDSYNRLLRAYCDGHLYRTQGTTLARLTRARTEKETVLSRYDLTDAELHEFLKKCRQTIADLSRRVSAGDVSVIRSVSGSGELAKLSQRLDLLASGGVNLAPPFRTRNR